ncbi:hypothetical protein IRM71_01075 [Erwinia amylovora]|uniref:hypothetical protein n=2 Tax=Erwinia amylovora TaxID=552 RepID=UPI000C071ECC|nr:hypothetical protein [Erwinia amylovora]UDJ86665.1 hypothetical protein IRM68_16855 [Erwinia amylovora]UDK89817.1 hypothetical protein IRM70_01065 [Erwinia amylovora]UDK93214.1 hypothetical protein IRM71_01075 [Erwinia amylovora]UOD74044.1 hypothetical protein IRM67_13775 [Erwinia amylovora]
MKVNPFYSEDKASVDLRKMSNERRCSLTDLGNNVLFNCIDHVENTPGKLKRAKASTELNHNVSHLPDQTLCKIEYKLLSRLSSRSAENYVYCGMIAGFPKNNLGMTISDEGHLLLIKGKSFNLIEGLLKKLSVGYEYYSAALTDFQCGIKFSRIYVNESGILKGEEKYTGRAYSIEIKPESNQEDIAGQYVSIACQEYKKNERDNLLFKTDNDKLISFSYEAGTLRAKISQGVENESDLSFGYAEIKLPLKKKYKIINIKRAINTLQIAVTSGNKSRIYYLNPNHISSDGLFARKLSHKPPQIFSSRLGSDPHEKYHAGQPFSSDRRGNFSARRIPLFSSVANNSRFHVKEASLKKAEGRNILAAIDMAKGLDIGIDGIYSTTSGMITRYNSGQPRHHAEDGKSSFESRLEFLTSRGKKVSGVINDALGHRRKLGLSDALTELSQKLHAEDTIHIASSDRISGFFGIASGGIPFCPGWFAGILGGISRSHSLSLSRTDEASVKLTFTHQFWRGVTGLVGTGQGLERTLLGFHGMDYMTVLPAEANLIIATQFSDKKDFAFSLSNNDFILFIRQFDNDAIEPGLIKRIISQSELSELKEKECVIMLEAKSELRLEIGGMANPNTYLVVPRTALGARLALNLLKASSTSQLIVDKNDNITRINKYNAVLMNPELDTFNEKKIMPVAIYNGETVLCVPLPLTEESEVIHQYRTEHGGVQWEKVVTKHLKLSRNIKSGSEKDVKEYYSQNHNISELNSIPFFLTLVDGLSVRKGLTLEQVAKYEDVIFSIMKKMHEIKDSVSQQERMSLGKSCMIFLVSHYETIRHYSVNNHRGYRLKKLELRRLGTLGHEAATIPLSIIHFLSKNEISHDERLGDICFLYRHEADIIPFAIDSRLKLLY